MSRPMSAFLLVCLAAIVMTRPVGAATLLALESDSGDSVGGGRRQLFTPDDGTFAATRYGNGIVDIAFNGGGAPAIGRSTSRPLTGVRSFLGRTRASACRWKSPACLACWWPTDSPARACRGDSSCSRRHTVLATRCSPSRRTSSNTVVGRGPRSSGPSDIKRGTRPARARPTGPRVTIRTPAPRRPHARARRASARARSVVRPPVASARSLASATRRRERAFRPHRSLTEPPVATRMRARRGTIATAVETAPAALPSTATTTAHAPTTPATPSGAACTNRSPAYAGRPESRRRRSSWTTRRTANIRRRAACIPLPTPTFPSAHTRALGVGVVSSRPSQRWVLECDLRSTTRQELAQAPMTGS